MIRPVSDYTYRVSIEFMGGDIEEHTKCSPPRWDPVALQFETLDGSTHVYILDNIVMFRFKKQESK